MHEVALGSGAYTAARLGHATVVPPVPKKPQCSISRHSGRRGRVGRGVEPGHRVRPPCGHKSPVRHNLFVAPGVIHGGTRGLVAAQTRADYFCGAA